MYLKRIVEEKIEKIIKTGRAIQIIGPKWCGKTTLASKYCKSTINFQDPSKKDYYRYTINENIYSLLSHPKPLLIDEWQEFKEIWNAIKIKVDQSTSNETEYFLTGSTVPYSTEGLHTGIGRIVTVKLSTFTLYETGESDGFVSLRTLFDKNTHIQHNNKELNLEEIAFYICRGGWPEASTRFKEEPTQIAKDYFENLIDKDLSNYDGVKRSKQLASAILYSYARNISTIDNQNKKNKVIFDDVRHNYGEVTDMTIINYLNVFKSLFVIQELRAWSPNIRSKTKIRTGKKKLFLDTSIACAALKQKPRELLNDVRTLGLLFENFVAHELITYLQDYGEIEHYRDDYGIECDFVLRMANGKYALCQSKLTLNNIEGAINAMEKICDLIIKHNEKKPETPHKLPSFLMVVVGSSSIAYTKQSKHNIPIHIVPINTLKP
ncbi:MAG: DUF4143 domain-containing protein [Mycoplasma sp.]